MTNYNWKPELLISSFEMMCEIISDMTIKKKKKKRVESLISASPVSGLVLFAAALSQISQTEGNEAS